jgi:hypothetical protein
LDVFRITSPSPFSITVLVASPLSWAFRFGLPGPTAVRPRLPCLLLFSELRHSVATGLRAGSPSRGRHLWARMCLVGAAWVELLKSSVTRRDGSESDSLDPPDASCAGRALLVSKLPSSGPAARRPVISAPTWRPCGSCPDPRLAAPGLRESPSVPCIESVGMRSRFGWARGSTGLTEGSVCFWGSFQLGKLSVTAAPTPPSDCSWAPAVSSFLTQIRLWSGWLR